MKKCSHCGETKDDGEFTYHRKTKDHLGSWCRECRRVDGNPKRVRIRRDLSEYKAEHGCLLCQEKDPIHLDLHHTDKKLKLFTIGTSYFKPWEEIIAEIRKCVVLCDRCHGRYHQNIRWAAKKSVHNLAVHN